MPSLLEKLSYYDPETGATFVVASDGFYWKEGKKSPEDSKITKLVANYGWRLQHGTNAFLVFQHKRDRNALFVVRGNKRWFYELRDENGELYRVGAKGKGLDELQDALKKGLLDEESMDKAASPAATAVNNAGNGHSEVGGGNWLLERRILGYDATDDDLSPIFWPEGEKQLTLEQAKSDEEAEARTKVKMDRIRQHLIENSKGVLSSLLKKKSREPMHDDSGACTGLRNRPDYGESDSYTSEMNDANTKGACLVLDGKAKTASGVTKIPLYVTAVGYERGNALKLASFELTPDPQQAKVFMPRTAMNLARQMRRLCGQTPKFAKPGGSLLTTQNTKTQK